MLSLSSFQPQSYYGRNLSATAAGYLGAFNHGYALTSPPQASATTATSSSHHLPPPPPLRSSNAMQPVNPYVSSSTSYGGVHVRPPASPSAVSSPASSGLSSAAGATKGGGYYAGAVNNTSFDYVPASAYCRDGGLMDNYAVYVNGSASSSSFLNRHEVVVPSVHGRTSMHKASSSSSPDGGSSLATHV